MENKFLPISKKDMEIRGIEQLDFVLINGDVYVDHPSFGGAIISRVLESVGYSVGIIAQPDWKDVNAFKKLGKPRLGFLVTGGNIDPMVNHYTVNKKLRRKDSYSPGGKMGCRPDRTTIVYCNMLKQAYKDVPIIVGGIEGSLRRFAHYDYWSNSVRRSILMDSRADLLVYGMGEKAIMDIADCLNSGIEAQYIRHIPGTCYKVKDINEVYDYTEVPSYKNVSENKNEYAKAFKIQYDQQDAIRGRVLVQKHADTFVVQNPPALVLSPDELDWVYSLAYTRKYHPIYKKDGGIPAISEVKYSIASSRGCFGSCSFCALTFHQGRVVQGRSHESIIDEAKEIIKDDEFKGYIHDVGGPTANFRAPACDKQLTKGACKERQCLFPTPCKNLNVSHQEYTELLTKLRKLEGVKKVFVRSGLRYDYIMADKDDSFLYNLCKNHVSGQLKVAPEHVADEVLALMGKPKREVFDRFSKKYYDINKKIGKEQYLIPYLMSSHPGSTINSAIKLAEYLRDIHYQPEQVQDFYPTPGTLSTTMFYTGIDPRNGKKVYIPKDKKEKAMQRALLQFSNPRNYDLVYDALMLAGRRDLIGFGPKCLIKPRKKEGFNQASSNKSSSNKSSSNKYGKKKFSNHKRK